MSLETIQAGITVPTNGSKLVRFQTDINFYYDTNNHLNTCSISGSITNKDILGKKWKLIGVGLLTGWCD